MVWHVQHALGPEWYFNPRRWRTVDGYAPYFVVIHAYVASHAEAALARLSIARAVSLALAKPDEQAREWKKEQAASEGR